MATTSSTLVAGKAAVAGQGGDGKGSKRRLVAAVAAGALGLSLLLGGVLVQGQRAATSAATQASAPAQAGARPVGASTDAGYRWDFGQDRPGLRPADASVAADYRWAAGEPQLLPGGVQAGYRVSAPNERDPDGRAGATAVQRPAGASVADEYRWAFGAASPAAGPLPADASTSAEYRWDFAQYPSR